MSDDTIKRLRDRLASWRESGITGLWINFLDLAAILDRLDKAERENERLRQLERSVLLALPGVYYMDPSDGGDVQMDEQLRRMAKDAARYRWLRGDSCPDHSIRWTQWEVRCWRSPVWSYDLRRQELDQAIDDARGVEQPEGKE